MRQLLYEISIDTEMDIVLVQQKTVQLSQMVGFSGLAQTQLGTAVSEIARNTIEHAVQGHIRCYLIAGEDKPPAVEIVISDAGQGIDPRIYSTDKPGPLLEKGHGISRAKKLADAFCIESTTQGTTVTLQKQLPEETVIDPNLIRNWKAQLYTTDPSDGRSPYEILKIKNRELMALMQQLEEKNATNQQQVEEIRALNGVLDQKNQDLTEFAYTLSHDLKNPLFNILALVPLARQAENKDPFFAKIETSAQGIKDILDGLMQIIDVDQDAVALTQPVQFQEIIDALKEEYQSEITASQGEVRTNFEVAAINYVPPYLNSIIRNLVSNAIKYRAEERPLQVTVATRRQEPYVVLSVGDNGTGIDLSKYQKELFKPFRRLTYQESGKGLGLHIIKRMIEKNGGRISVESTVGEGTVFACYLKEYEH